MKLLLVEDEPSIVKMVRKRLEVAGYEVLVAQDGQEGLAKAQAEQPDLIILDLMLPKLSGYEVCRLLKFDQKFQDIPIIMLTARSRQEDMDQGQAVGADAYMTKPFNSSDLLAKVQELLAKGPSQPDG